MIFGFFKKRLGKQAQQKGTPKPEGEVLGSMTHYFPHCKAGVLKLQSSLSIGDTIRIKGHTSDFKQKISSMQVDGKDISSAKKGDEVGLLVKKRVRVHDTVYKV